MDPVSLPPMPTTVTPERAPGLAAKFDDLLDAFNPAFRSAFVCEVYVVYRAEDASGRFTITQVSPQQRTGDPSAPGGTDDMISTGGQVGSGGHRPLDASDPGFAT